MHFIVDYAGSFAYYANIMYNALPPYYAPNYAGIIGLINPSQIIQIV